jgi:hypothetical protein
VTDQDLKEIPRKTLEDPSSDLGFGRVVSEQRQLRLLNRDGSFNVQKRGRGLNSFLAYSLRSMAVSPCCTTLPDRAAW